MIQIMRIFIIGMIPILQTVLLIFAFRFPDFFIVLTISGIIMTDLGIAFLMRPNTLKGELFVTSIPSLALMISISGMILFVEDPRLIYLLIGSNAGIQCVYFVNLYLYSFKKIHYQERLFAHISNACNTFSVYLLSSCLFAVIYYLDIHFWILLVGFLGVAVLFYVATLKVYSLQIKMRSMHLLYLALMAGEIALILHWNSFPWYIASLVYTAFYSTFEQLSIGHKLHELSIPKIVIHFIVLASVIVLSIFTIS